jgi:hypothetical protein
MSRIHSIYPLPIANIGTGTIGPYAGSVTKPIDPATTMQSSVSNWINYVIISVFND